VFAAITEEKKMRVNIDKTEAQAVAFTLCEVAGALSQYAKESDVLQEVLENVEDTLYHVFDHETQSRKRKKANEV
jgi:invasion protein IalB